jgi:hypothetical protein
MFAADYRCLAGLDFFSVGGIVWVKCHSVSLFTLLSSPFYPWTLCFMEYFTSKPTVRSILNFKFSTFWATFFLYIVTCWVCHATNNFTPSWIKRIYSTLALTITQFTVSQLLPSAVSHLLLLL